jgi:genome maintenance exonuclease 1
MTRKLFKHELIELANLKTVTVHGKRHYELPDGSLVQSVTTILDRALDKTALIEWKARVGDVKAQKITTQAANRGTAIHNICEAYLLNKEEYPQNSMPTNIDSFKQIKPYLDANINKIYGIESPLYSYRLKTAGRTDCIAEWNGIPSIIDFKTSRKLKKEEWIESYFIQATTYSLMAEELTDLTIPQIVIIIAVDNEEPQLFIKNKSQYVNRVNEIFGD